MRASPTRHRVALALALIGALGHLCLLCLTMDAVIVAWAVTVAPLASRFGSPAHPGWWHGRAAARTVAAGAALLALGGGTWAAMRTPATALTVTDVQSRDP